MRDEFYIKESTGTFGPVTFARLVELIRSGRFTLQHLIKQGRNGKWIAAEMVMKSLKQRYPELTTATSDCNETKPKPDILPDVELHVPAKTIHRSVPKSTGATLSYKMWDIWDSSTVILKSRVTWIFLIAAIWLGANYHYYQKIANPFSTETSYYKIYVQI
ncbi:MAG: hypothetical protein R3C11_27695 [Planctomycetaceae bacterium]